jgi:hypothetical protein
VPGTRNEEFAFFAVGSNCEFSYIDEDQYIRDILVMVIRLCSLSGCSSAFITCKSGKSWNFFDGRMMIG